MEEFQADILVFFITSWSYATVEKSTGGQIWQVSYSKLQYGSAVLQYAF